MRRPSFAYDNFLTSVSIIDTLLEREKKYKEPLKLRNFKIVKGLRGGALVLMVASFENYLKEAMEERLNELSTSPTFKFVSLPINIKHYHHRQTFYNSLNPHTKLDKVQKISKFEQASNIIVSQKINPEAFSVSIRSNPNSEKVTEFFKSVGYEKFFPKINPKFEKKIGKAIDVQATLDSIIIQRNLVAHSFAHSITLSRYELDEHLNFLKVLSEICDDELYNKMRSLKR